MQPNPPIPPGDENVARLLGQAYEPQDVPAEFARRVHGRMQAAAAEAARQRLPLPLPRPRDGSVPRRLAWVAGMAAMLGCIAVGLQFGPWTQTPTAHVAHTPSPAVQQPVPARLTAAPRPAVGEAETLTPGVTLATRAGERRRVLLSDGSVLFVNQNTRLHLDADRRVTLHQGEVFVEVAPRAPETFVVQTPKRAVTALGTKFVVRADEAGTGVVVTQGKVKVSDWGGVLVAGERLPAGATRAEPAPRFSHLLDWARDLLGDAGGRLVPESRHGGGDLVAVDPHGQEARLSLRKYQIDVHVEDGFARTTIDQTYFNHLPSRVEGTFYFPLPADASLSRLAMYVNGDLNEGGMVDRDEGRAIYQQIVTKMQDPALLEWMDGTTFKMRVFPLEARQEKRIILSYTQKVPVLYGRTSYRFPAGHSLGQVSDWSFYGRVKGGAGLNWHSDSHALTARTENHDLVLTASGRDVKPDRDVVLDLYEQSPDSAPHDDARFSSAEHEGAKYLMLRYRPALPAEKKRQRRDWVFLFESSGDRDPLLARTQVEVVRTLLANAEHEDTFSVLAAGARVQPFADRPRPATPENVAAAVAFLEQAHLVGALDLEKALDAAAPLLASADNPHLVHVGSGLAALGERRAERLARKVPTSARYVGVGVGKRWGRDFMKLVAERTGGAFTQINPDEPIGWRAFELSATLNTPRLLGARVADPAGKATFLTHATAVAQGEELCAIARVEGNAQMPEQVKITGTLDGQPYERTIDVGDIRPKADYLPRTWAKLEIERLLAENSAGNKDRIVALSKAMYVMTPYTSLLVLENEAMYAQFKVDRGRKDHWAMYPCPPKVRVVYEPLPGMAGAPAPAQPTGKPTAEQVLATLVFRAPAAVAFSPDGRVLATGAGDNTILLWDATPGKQHLDQLTELERLAEVTTYTRSLPRVYTYTDRLDQGKSRGAPGGATPVGKPGATPTINTNGSAPSFDLAFPQSTNPYAQGFGGGGFAPGFGGAPNFGYGYYNRGFGGGGLGAFGGSGGFGGGFGTGLGAPGAGFGINPEAARFGELTLGKTLANPGQPSSPYLNFLGNSLLHSGAGRYVQPPSSSVALDYYAVLNQRTLTESPTLLRSDLGWWYERSAAPVNATGLNPPVMNGPPLAAAAFPGLVPSLRNTDGLEVAQQLEHMKQVIATHERQRAYVEMDRKKARIQPEIAAETLGLAGELPAGIRAVSLRIDPKKVVGGPLAPKSRVDVAWTRRLDNGEGMTRVIKQNMTVLAADVINDREEGKRRFAGTTVTLAATPEDAAELALAGSLGEFRLISRGTDDAELVREQMRLLSEMAKQGLVTFAVIYQRPQATVDIRSFRDLLAFAPGMSTSAADVRAVLQSEAGVGDDVRPGKIDPAAREMIDRARAIGWRSLDVAAAEGRPAFSVTLDGKGRYRWDRVLQWGLRETVVCDGQTLLHLYPDLGLAARRTPRRYHAAEFRQLVPWLLPTAGELARGADLRKVDDHTVAVVVPDAPVVHLVFAADGRLAERKVLDATGGTVLARETYAADGTVRRLDADGKGVVVSDWTVRSADKPDLSPDLEELVVLNLPARTRAHVMRNVPHGNQQIVHAEVSNATALELLLSDEVFGTPVMADLIREKFLKKGDQRIGFRTLLLASGHPLGMEPPAAWRDSLPLERYSRQVESFIQDRRVWSGGPLKTFWERMEAFYEIFTRWQNSSSVVISEDEARRLLAFVSGCGSPTTAWAATDLVLRNATNKEEGKPDANGLKKKLLEAACKATEAAPALHYVARYEQARFLHQTGDKQNAAELFEELYKKAAGDVLPPIDGDFRAALTAAGSWDKFIRQTAARLVAEDHRFAVAALAEQCAALGGAPLAGDLIDLSLRGAGDLERGALLLAGVQLLMRQAQLEKADRLFDELMRDSTRAKLPELWRLGVALSQARNQVPRAMTRLERALDLEYAARPEVIDLEAVRRDFGQLLAHYEKVAEATTVLQQQPPADFLDRVIRFADRWRALDKDSPLPCESATRTLTQLGATDLAWDYRTTPLAQQSDPNAWLGLAREAAARGDAQHADRAFAATFALNPTTPDVLWERAVNLCRPAPTPEARALFREILNGAWGANTPAWKEKAGAQLAR
jgi:ferric-dicitrate binding protein FerR (iron transport regulator)/tetratricopeptide (TPR) repeat protein